MDPFTRRIMMGPFGSPSPSPGQNMPGQGMTGNGTGPYQLPAGSGMAMTADAASRREMASGAPAYFTKEENSILPDFNINRVIVEEKFIRVICSLQKNKDLGYNEFLGSSEFLKYVKFDFLMTSQLLRDFELSAFYYPKSRAYSLGQIVREDQLDAEGRTPMIRGVRRDDAYYTLNWRRALGEPADFDGTGPEYDNKYIGRITALTTVPYDSISRGNRQFTSRIRDVYASRVFDRYAHAEIYKPRIAPSYLSLEELDGTANQFVSGEDDSVQFEVEVIPQSYTYLKRGAFYDPNTPAGEIHLLAFAHLDVAKIARDYKLGNLVGSLALYGGPLKYIQILQGNVVQSGVMASGNGVYRYNWTVPEFSNVFTDQQGNPWNGVAHYHSEENPGPNGYIGWMSGPPGEDAITPMTSRKKLTMVQVPNAKVTSKVFIQGGGALDVNGNPIQTNSTNTEITGIDTRYVGIEYPVPNPTIIAHQNKTPSDYGILTIGDNLLDVLKKEIGMSSMTPGNPIYEQKRRYLSVLSERKRKPAFFSGFNQEFDNSSWLNVGNNYSDSYYGIIAMMSTDNILKNSRLGYMLDFHLQETFVGDVFQPPRFDTTGDDRYNAEALSYDFLRACYMNNKTYGIKINRKRVTSTPSSNNPVGTPSYENYDTNQIEETIFLSHARGDAPLSFMENTLTEKAAIQVRPVSGDVTGNSHVFIIKDYDLFRNVTQGKYQYSIEMSVSNTIFDVLVGLYDNFSQLIDEYSEYVNLASKPFYSDATGQNHNFGSYIYEDEIFSQNFKDRVESEQLASVLPTITYQYMRILYLVSKNKQALGSTFHKDLITSLSPRSGNLPNLEFFLDLCLKLQSVLRKIIFPKGDRQKDKINYGTKKTTPKTNSYFEKIIKVQAKLKNTVKACSKNSVFFQPQVLAPDSGSNTNRFFTITEVIPRSQPVNILEGTLPNLEYNSAGEALSVRPRGFSITEISAVNGNSLAPAIASSINRSQYGETYSSDTQFQSDNPVERLSGLLSYAAGTTFADLLSLYIAPDNDPDQEDTGNISQALLSSIEQSDSSLQFKQRIDQIYENNYYTENNLGELYYFIMSVLSMKNLELGMEEETKQNFEMLSKRGITISQNRDRQREAYNLSSRNINGGNLLDASNYTRNLDN